MTDHDWWWHFLHDPMRDNPWSTGAMVLLMVVTVSVLWWRSGR